MNKPISKQPLPENAKRVFKGQIFDVYQWEQEMFDGSTQIFEKLKRPDTVVTIPVMEDGNIALTEEEQPGKDSFLSVPGGRAEEDEAPEVCAERELLEETGYKSDNLTLWFATQPIPKIDWTIYVYIAKNCKKIKEPELDAGEKITIRMVSLEEFLELSLKEELADFEIIFEVMKAKLNPEKMAKLKKAFLV